MSYTLLARPTTRTTLYFARIVQKFAQNVQKCAQNLIFYPMLAFLTPCILFFCQNWIPHDIKLDIKHAIYDYLLASNIIFKLVKRRVYSCAVWRPPGSPGGGGGAGFGWGEGGDQAGGGAQAAQGPLKAVGHLDQFHDPVLHH